MPKIKSKVDHDEAVRMYSEGYEITEIAERFDTTRSYVRDILRRRQVTFREENSLDVGKIKALYRAGWQIPAIALELYTSTEKIREILKEMEKV